MASDFEHRIVYRKDERGVILDSAVVGPDEDVPEGFEDKAEYESYVPSATEGPPVDESKLTVSEEKVDLRYTVDAIKAENEAQEGPSDPGGLKENPDALDAPEDGPQPGDVVAASDGSSEHDADETVDETKGDAQEGPSDPGGDAPADDVKPSARRSSSKK